MVTPSPKCCDLLIENGDPLVLTLQWWPVAKSLKEVGHTACFAARLRIEIEWPAWICPQNLWQKLRPKFKQTKV